MLFLYQGTIVRTPARPLTTEEKILVIKGYQPQNALLTRKEGELFLQVKNDQVKKIKWVSPEHQRPATT